MTNKERKEKYCFKVDEFIKLVDSYFPLEFIPGGANYQFGDKRCYVIKVAQIELNIISYSYSLISEIRIFGIDEKWSLEIEFNKDHYEFKHLQRGIWTNTTGPQELILPTIANLLRKKLPEECKIFDRDYKLNMILK